MAQNAADSCIICDEKFSPGSEYVQLTGKGCEGIQSASKARGEELLVNVGDYVHKKCRQMYVNKKDIENKLKKSEKMNPQGSKRPLRSSEKNDCDKNLCLFCNHEVKMNSGNNPIDGSAVKTHGEGSFTASISKIAKQRGDEWAVIVSGRIAYFMNDLHANDIVYHHCCSINFRTFRAIPKQYSDAVTIGGGKPLKKGRPEDEDANRAFQAVCSYFEQNDDEQLTIDDLVEKMRHYLENSSCEPFSSKHMKRKLLDHYGDCIRISGESGKRDIVTHSDNQDRILRDFFDRSEYGTEKEKKDWILKTAARLIKADIKDLVPPTKDTYPSSEEINIESAENYLPDSLQQFCHNLFVGKNTSRKVAAIGQAIVQAVRPVAVVAPLQLGLGVQIHHLTRSRAIVEILHSMGFSVSYREVLKFEQNAASSQLNTLVGESSDAKAMLMAADNVDHNTGTIDGKQTFHGMGMIAAFTPKRKVVEIVPRLNNLNMAERSRIPILEYREAVAVCQTKFGPLPTFAALTDVSVDDLWRLSVRFRSHTPNWSGMMALCKKNDKHPGVSSVDFLPMIDLYPGDLDCIYSTLTFLTNFARTQGFPAIITFDQPLYFKAAEMMEKSKPDSHLRDVVLLLGSFHTAMNLLGAIGYLMQGTGISDILSTVYGENTVEQILKGKAFQRAFRAHNLLDRALMYEITETLSESDRYNELITECESKFELFKNGDLLLIDLKAEISEMRTMVETERRKLIESSLTCKLWSEYLDTLQILRDLVAADRSGNWSLHLAAVKSSLPAFAASGHYNYLKSAYLYVQKMSALEQTKPEVYEMFKKGYHVIRRSDKFWAGLGSDLTIEQCLMRSLKSNTGLTRGSGMTESLRAIWTMSMPVCATINLRMQEFGKFTFTTSDQHQELTKSRSDRDDSDLRKLIAKLKDHSPFKNDGPELRNIITGTIAHANVNVHEWRKCGEDVVSKMDGQNVFTYSFKRKNKVQNLASVYKVKVSDDRSIDPALLFQRFLVVAQNGELEYDDVLKHELCTFPPCLFESPSILRQADKPPLATAILNHTKSEPLVKLKTCVSVLDGGSLMRRVQWTQGSTYGEIAESYAKFVIRHYTNAVVVFDGYRDGPNIKDCTHERRKTKDTTAVVVAPNKRFVGKKEDFLSLGQQKQRLIGLIINCMNSSGIETVQADGDADVLIAQTAVSASQFRSTSLIGEDTDLLVLAIYYSQSSSYKQHDKLYMYSDKDASKNVYDVHELAASLGPISAILPFFHAFTGCDTTSRIYGVGKETAFRKFCGDPVLQRCAVIFSDPNQSQDAIAESGEKAMCRIFDGKGSDINKIRSKVLLTKVINAKSFVSPEKIPPTASATKFHSFRVHYQTLVFMDKAGNLNAQDWGWRVENGKFIPITMNELPAPQSLLKIIHCNCTTGCETKRCTCRKQGFECSSACGHCQDANCFNVPKGSDDSDDVDEG